MAALLLDLQPGDEVIMPSYTFVSTANAFVLRGATPVFVDIRPDTLNIDERLIEAAITPRTRAIVPVHYAGVPCDMDAILEIANRHGLFVVEDAAQALLSTFRGRPAGGIGHLAAISFHETKNVIAGEGGALVINDPRFAERAEILWEKGTDRTRFSRGEVDKYTWVDLGSSFLPGEITAEILSAQLEHAADITAERHAVWDVYHEAAAMLEPFGITRPTVPSDCRHNAHKFYLLLPDAAQRPEVLAELNQRGVNAIFHYIPLHSAPAVRRFGRTSGSMGVTESSISRLIRLPLWAGIGAAGARQVVEHLTSTVTSRV
jgi:dTDP-4-amino-4,6-dideoxygalactose transaminase